MKSNTLGIGWLVSVLFFAACSGNSDEPAPVSVPTDARVTIAVKAQSAATRAVVDPNAQAGEININRLTAFIFNEDGTELLGSKTDTVGSADGEGKILDVPARSVKARIVVVANAPEHAFDGVQTLGDFREMQAELPSQTQQNLTMSTPEIVTDSPLAKDDNYIGFGGVDNVNGLGTPLALTRIAARIDVAKIAVDFKGTELNGRTVRIDGMYLAKAKSASLYASADHWGAVEVAGKLVYGTGAEQVAGFLSGVEQPADYLTRIPSGMTVQENAPVKNACSFYTFENKADAAHTTLVVKATLLAQSPWKAQERYFTAVVNPDGKALRYDHDYIRRNYVYRLNITFTGKSFPDNEYDVADLRVSISVAPWNTVLVTPDLE